MERNLENNNHTCAVCHGPIKQINTVFWKGHAIELCVACLFLGDGTLSPDKDEVKYLLNSRANPDAPTTGFEGRVRVWINKKVEGK